MAIGIGRREVIAAFGGAAVVWASAARTQQPDRMRHIGVLMPLPKDDREARQRLDILKQALGQLGWIEGGNIAFEARYTDVGPEQLPTLAAELVRAKVDVIVTQAAQLIEAVRAATNTIPIVMARPSAMQWALVISRVWRDLGEISLGSRCSRPIRARSGCS